MGIGIGLGLIAAGSAAYAAKSQSDSAAAANKANNKAAKNANMTNVLLNLISRGAPASGPLVPGDLQGRESAILPYYFDDTERKIGTGASNAYDAIQSLYGSPQLQAEDYARILQKYQPAFDNSDQTAIDIGSGDITRQSLDESQPVFQSRIDAANTKKNSALESLNQTLNEIDAIQARKGYSGDSYGNRMLKFNARRSIAGSAADDISQAMLQNALEKRSIQSEGRNLQIQNIGLPDTLARAAIARKGLPGAAVSQNYTSSLQPFQFFNMGPHSFSPVDPGPPVQPVAGAGQIAGQAIGATAGAASNYFLQKSLQDKAYTNYYSGQIGSRYGSGVVPTNFGTFTPAQQADYVNQLSAAKSYSGPSLE